jgi:hypothetical protein
MNRDGSSGGLVVRILVLNAMGVERLLAFFLNGNQYAKKDGEVTGFCAAQDHTKRRVKPQIARLSRE